MAIIALHYSVLSRVHIRLPGRIFVIALCTLAILVFARPASADTRTVTNTLDSGPGSLRQVVLDAAPDGIVFFSSAVFNVPLTITLTSGQIEISKSLTIDGAYGGVVTPTISGADTTRIFQVDAGVSVTISRVSLVNGYCEGGYCYGGAVYNDGALNITGSLLFGNRAAYGGAVYNSSSGVISLTQSNMMSNTALQGSAIYNWGTLDVSHSIFFHNGTGPQPGWGGGIYSYGTLNIDSSTFIQNSTYEGGGIYVGSGYANISSSSFISNFGVYGGGIRNRGGVVNVINSAFNNNIGIMGGGIANYYLTRVINCTFANNFFGAIFNETILYVTNSTIVSNTSDPDQGGGISNWALTVLTNTIVANNVPGGDCFTDSAASTIDGGHNLESSNTCGFSVPSSMPNTNPLLGPLGYHGGPVMTLPILPGSPAIDAGDDSACPPTDARGVPRPFGAHCDIGAYEANWPLYYFPVVARQ